jgi:zinc transport system ATP-binding protein
MIPIPMPAPLTDAVSTPLLAANGVSFSYGSTPVLHDVSLAVRRGEFVALVGPNGSGKTTLLRCLVGLARPGAGETRLFGDDPALRRHGGCLGYVPQRPALAEGLSATVEDIVSAGRLARRSWVGGRRRADQGPIDAALEAVDLLELRRERISRLSGGQQQRAFIARALAGEPDLLVLDEPVAGLDVESQQCFRRSLVGLVERGGAVLLVSHELGAVADALDRVIVLKRSVRFDGTPEELVASGVSLGVHEQDLPLWLEGVR